MRKQQVGDKTVKKNEDVKEGEEVAGEVGEKTQEGAHEEDEKFLDEDNGSVASSTKSLLNHLRMLRNALYENYSPPSIRNLNLNGRLVFVVLMIITIIWYVYSALQYQQLKDNIENIHSSKHRIDSLTQIAADVRSLSGINQGRINKTRGGLDYE